MGGRSVDPILVVILTMVAAGVIAAIAFSVRKSRRNRERLSSLAADLDAEQIAPGKTFRGELGGQTYWFEFFEGGKNSPSYLKVWLECPSSGSFKLRPENAFDRFFKRLGIAVEIQTGDRDFDETTYVSTDEVAFAHRFLAPPEKREAALGLIRQGFKEVSHDGKTMEAKRTPFSFGEQLDRQTVENAVQYLIPLCRNLPGETYEGRIGGTPAWKIQRNVLLGVSGAAAAIGLVLTLWGSEAYPPLDGGALMALSLRYSAPTLLVFLVLSVALLRGRSSSHLELVFVTLLSAFGAIVGGFGAVAVLNGSLDRGEATPHDAVVLDRRKTSGRSQSHYVTVESWREGGDGEEVEVWEGLYDGAGRRGARLRVVTRPGHLGFEWVDRLELLPPDADVDWVE